jgi:hypothetical protein
LAELRLQNFLWSTKTLCHVPLQDPTSVRHPGEEVAEDPRVAISAIPIEVLSFLLIAPFSRARRERKKRKALHKKKQEPQQ